MWKIVIALVISLGFVAALSTVMTLVGPAPYVVALIVGALWAILTTTADRMSWAVVIGAAAVGAVFFWGFGQTWAVYLFIISASVLAATLAVLVTGRRRDPLSDVHASKGSGG